MIHTWSVHFISLVDPHVVSSFYFNGCSTHGQFVLFHWLFHTIMVSLFNFNGCSTCGQFILFHWLFHMWSVYFIPLAIPHVARGQFILFHWLFHKWSVRFISFVVPSVIIRILGYFNKNVSKPSVIPIREISKVCTQLKWNKIRKTEVKSTPSMRVIWFIRVLEVLILTLSQRFFYWDSVVFYFIFFISLIFWFLLPRKYVKQYSTIILGKSLV